MGEGEFMKQKAGCKKQFTYHVLRFTHHGEIHYQHFHHQPRRNIPIHLPQRATAGIGGGFGLVQIDALGQGLNLRRAIDVDQFR